MHAAVLQVIRTARRPVSRCACRIVAGVRHRQVYQQPLSHRHFHPSPAFNRTPEDPSISAAEEGKGLTPNKEAANSQGVNPGDDGTNEDTTKVLEDTDVEAVTNSPQLRGRNGRAGGRVKPNRPKQPEGLPTVILPEWFCKNNVKRAEDAPMRGSLAVYATSTASLEEMAEGDTAILDTVRMEKAVEECGLPSPEDARYAMHVDVYTEIYSAVKAELSLKPPKNAESPSINRPIIHLQCPQDGGSFYLDSAMETIASKLKADLISLDAHDIAQIIGSYIEENAAWSQSNMATLAYETQGEAGNLEAFDIDPSSEAAEGEEEEPAIFGLPSLSSRLSAMLNKRKGNRPNKLPNPFTASFELPGMALLGGRMDPQQLSSSQPETDNWNSLKLSSVFNTLVNAAEGKTAALQNEGSEQVEASLIKKSAGTIILVRDYKSLQATTQGSDLLARLRTAVHKRWKEGNNIIIVGTTSTEHGEPALSKQEIQKLQSDILDGEKRSIYVPPQRHEEQEAAFEADEKTRFRDINIRHIEHMIKSLLENSENPSLVIDIEKDLDTSIITASGLEDAVWTYARVHRVATMVLGLEDSVTTVDGVLLGRALTVLNSSDEVKFEWGAAELKEENSDAEAMLESEDTSATKKNEMTREKIKAIRKNCKPHEKKLLNGVIIPSELRTTFDDIRAPKETVEALKTLTSLSLIRPEAFSYGVLATNKIPGTLVYGPPGCGKTLLAKAVAKESGATMLEISGADVNDMYVGEGEKNVKAVFSLAKKLSPCVVFIDEADAIFSSRGDSKSRGSTHRELINQFLREWDGMNDLSAFIMVATNRPFDLDEAVLRRLPRRLLVDLPVEKDREAILKIHLKGETLDKSVSLAKIAKDTPFYSGSDLKNVSVAAAMACIREENEAEAKHTGDTPYVFPEKRILTAKHFEKAMEEISASISEDMSTLSAIRKFDKTYGDKGRRKKTASLGFGGTTVVEKDSEAARVRKMEV